MDTTAIDHGHNNMYKYQRERDRGEGHGDIAPEPRHLGSVPRPPALSSEALRWLPARRKKNEKELHVSLCVCVCVCVCV